MITICRRYTFEAAHRLVHVPPEHKCATLHGHSYEVEIEIGGRVEASAWICDFAAIDLAWAPLHKVFDHQTLNDRFEAFDALVPGVLAYGWLLTNPTSENLAQAIARVFPMLLVRVTERLDLELRRVRVSETARSWAEWTPDP